VTALYVSRNKISKKLILGKIFRKSLYHRKH